MIFFAKFIKSNFVKTACLLGVMLTSCFASAEEELPAEFKNVGVSEKLGSVIKTDAKFFDHTGRAVQIGDLLKDGKPLLLTMNYYKCKMLCSLQLNALVEGLTKLGWTIGDRFKLATVSIDPRNTFQMAAEKRSQYLQSVNQPNGDWNFLTGEEVEIRLLAASVGFEYKYMPETDDYAHGLSVFFVSPNGKLTRYLYGLSYKPLDLKLALLDASDGIVATTVDRFIMNCFKYDSKHGRYNASILNLMRMGGLLTIAVLGSSLAVMWRRENVRKREESATCS